MSKVAVVAYTVLAAAALDARDFGVLVSLQAVALMAAVAWDLGLTTIITREIAAGHVGIGQATRRTARLRLETMPIGLAAFLIGLWLLGRTVALDPGIVAIMAVHAILVGIQVLVTAALVGTLDFRVAGIAMAVGRWTATLGALAAYLSPSGGLALAAAALVVGEAVIVVIGLRRLWLTATPMAKGTQDPEHALSHRAALPFAANGLLQMAYNRFDVLIVASVSSIGVLAAYAPASRVQDALLVFAVTAGPVALPMVARLFAEETDTARPTRRLWARITVAAVLSSFALAIAAWIAAPTVIPALLGETYRDAVGPIRIIVWSVPLIAFNSVLGAVVNARRAPRYVTAAIVSAAVTATLAILVLVPILGSEGAALAATLREIPVALVLLHGARRSGLFSDTRSAVGAVPRTPDGHVEVADPREARGR